MKWIQIFTNTYTPYLSFLRLNSFYFYLYPFFVLLIYATLKFIRLQYLLHLNDIGMLIDALNLVRHHLFSFEILSQEALDIIKSQLGYEWVLDWNPLRATIHMLTSYTKCHTLSLVEVRGSSIINYTCTKRLWKTSWIPLRHPVLSITLLPTLNYIDTPNIWGGASIIRSYKLIALQCSIEIDSLTLCAN